MTLLQSFGSGIAFGIGVVVTLMSCAVLMKKERETMLKDIKGVNEKIEKRLENQLICLTAIADAIREHKEK